MSKSYEYVKAFRKRRRQKIINYLGGECKICGRTDNLRVSYIDINDKSLDINRNLTRRWDLIEAEIKKCELLCTTHLEKKMNLEGLRGQKLTANQVEEIRSRYARGGIRQSDLAEEYGMKQSSISLIINKHIYKN